MQRVTRGLLAALVVTSITLPGLPARAATPDADFKSHRLLQDELHSSDAPRALSVPDASISAQSVEPNTATAHKVYGFHPYWENGSEANYRWSALSTLVFFKLEVTFDGYLNNNPNYQPPAGLVNLAHANGVRVEYAVTNDGPCKPNALLSSKTYYTRAADNLVAKVLADGADGINVDFEGLPASCRDQLTDFMTILSDKMHTAKPSSTVTIDTPAIDWNSTFNLPVLASVTDGLILMGYDYWGGWSSTAGPIAPLYDTAWRSNYSVASSVGTYLAAMPADKLILGVPWYGGSWETGGASVPQSVSGNDWLGPLLFSEAENEATEHNKNWYTPSRVPYTTAAAGSAFQTWYDDAQSLVEKYNFAEAQDLAGVAVWALGYEDGNQALWDGLSAYGQGVADSLQRLFGSNRYETAIAVSQAKFPTPKSAKGVVLATGENWPDALGGAVLAEWYAEGPLLLTAGADITPATATEIDRVLARDQGSRVYILGGTNAVSLEVTEDLEGLGFTVVRIAGNNRFETASKIATKLGTPTAAFMGTGANFPDILSMTGPATDKGQPILLTNKDSVPQASLDYLASTAGSSLSKIYLAGGASVISQAVVDQLKSLGFTPVRLGGADRYETSQKIANAFYPTPTQVALATGQTFADGLTGAVLAGSRNAPILLVQRDILPQPVWDYLEQHAASIIDGYLFGGTAAVSRAVQNVAQTLIAP